jgi:cell division protein ZipA
MSELRWILIGFGIVLLAGIYLWGRRSGAAVPEEVALRSRTEPPIHLDHLEEEPPLDVPEHVPEPVGEVETSAVHPVSAHSEARLTRAEPSPRPHAVEETYTVATETSRPLPDFRRGRIEPTIGSDVVTEELPAQPAVEDTTAALPAPTLSSSEATPPPRRPSARKILSLRLSLAPQRVEGARLQEVLQSELLTHGKYQIFHRLHSDGQAVFSVASMVEPGSFDLEKMSETLYPGVTLFAQLPGPVPGMHALNEMVACARRLHQTLGGVLQDDRGVPLTVHRIERMRQEVREFERPPGASARAGIKSEGWQG